MKLTGCQVDNRLCPSSTKQKKRDPKVSDFYSPFYVLRSDAVDVAGEHGAFLDVGDAEEASRDTLEADGEAAVRRHAVAEGLLSEPESIRIHTTTDHLLAVVGCSVRPSASALCSLLCPLSLCPSRAPQARIPRTPHGAHRTP